MAGAIKRQHEHGGARHALDKFYTKDALALTCLNSIQPLLSAADIVVEPSAGGGAFSRQITHPNLRAFDLEPEGDGIEAGNWFDVDRATLGKGGLLVVGNPPFGVRTDLAKRFIQHAVALEATTIAFVLPKTFSKILNQSAKLFPSHYRLVLETDMPEESFTVEGKSFHIPCRWYVWTSVASFMPGVDLRKQKVLDSTDFKFVGRGDATADFTLNGNNGRVKDVTAVTNPKAEHYIRVADRAQVAAVRERMSRLALDFNSSVNGGVAWVGKQEILAAYAATS